MLKYHNIIATTALLIAAAGGYYIGSKKCTAPACSISEERCALRTAMRKLWAEHVFWTRNYIISAIAESSDASAITDRLMKNQRDIGNALIPYYGREAGQKLTDLLKEHIGIAAEVVAAAKAHNQEKQHDADERWHENAEKIANFLSAENPHWSHDPFLKMLNAHLILTSEELTARLHKAWKDDVVSFNKVLDQALTMADQITNGIVAQFPQKF